MSGRDSLAACRRNQDSRSKYDSFRFAKNLSPDQISVEILRGKSELKNIELNEDVLTEALELPAWLKIKRAGCNRICVRVPWTRLKSAPVQLVRSFPPRIRLFDVDGNLLYI